MNKLTSLVKGLFNKAVNSGSSAGEKVKKIISLKIKLAILGPFVVPLLLIFMIFLIIASMFGEKMSLLQMVDTGGSSRFSGGMGTAIYTTADFEDAVIVTNSASLTTSIPDFASKLSGTSVGDLNSFNNAIKANVGKAGCGTAEGVVAAAMALSYEYSKLTGYKLFYEFSSNNPREGHDGVSELTLLDCRSFVQWAVYNGGFKAEELNYIGLYGVANIATVKSDVRSVKPGDIFSTDGTGHIWLVVGVAEDGYYAAEEFGYGNGLVINKYTWDNAYGGYAASLYDMSSYYNNPENVRSDYCSSMPSNTSSTNTNTNTTTTTTTNSTG